MTILRSIPCGRGGFSRGSWPAVIWSVHSAKYLNGAPPSWPANGLIMNGAAWPDWTRRIQASMLVFSSANAAGIVRVDSCPSWWHPTQDRFLIVTSQSSCVTLAGMPFSPPNSFLSGIRSSENQ